MSFEIADQHVDSDVHVIEVAGEVDLFTAPQLGERLEGVAEHGKTKVVVDLSKATFIDSSTLGVLVSALERLRPSGGSLSVVCCDPNVAKVFTITGLDRVFDMHANRHEAVEALSQARRLRPL